MGRYTGWFVFAWMIMAGMYAWIPGAEGNIMFYLMPVMASTIALNAVGNDQACRWDRFAAMTPLPPWVMVVEKYLFAYGVLALMTGLGALAGWVSTRGGGGLQMGTAVVMVSLLTAMGLPLVYRFGRQKSGLILLAIWVLVAAAVFGTAYRDYALVRGFFDWVEAVPGGVMAVGCTVVLAVLNVCSALLSVRFYIRRQRGWYD